MHSSRMRTARLLPVSPSMHCFQGGVPTWGCTCPGYLPRGVPAQRATCWRGVPAGGCTCQGVYLSGVYLPRGCACQGVNLLGGVSVHRGLYLPTGLYLPRRGVPARGCTCPGYLPRHSPLLWTDMCKNITFGNLVCGR